MAAQFLYFAYGSNLLSQRLRARTPSAVALGCAVLRGHELRWHMASRDGSGKCDVVSGPGTGQTVHGVVYRIASDEKKALDTAESLGVGYRQQIVEVELGAETAHALVYQALRVDASILPYDWYKTLVVSGALEHGLPALYRQQLKAAPCKPDPDAERSMRHYDLALRSP